MIAFHIGAIAALFFFSWRALGLAIVLSWISGGLGIGMGYHRLLAHRGYKTPKVMEYLLTTCGTLALEGGPIAWVATHRVPHQNTDKEGDPHSPRDGGLWAHNSSGELLLFVPDLRKDKFHVWISRWHWVPLTVLGLALFTIGGWPGYLRQNLVTSGGNFYNGWSISIQVRQPQKHTREPLFHSRSEQVRYVISVALDTGQKIGDQGV